MDTTESVRAIFSYLQIPYNEQCHLHTLIEDLITTVREAGFLDGYHASEVAHFFPEID